MLMAQRSHVKFNDAGKTLVGDELVEFLFGAEKAIVALETIDDEVLDKLPDLKVISKFGVGLDRIDLAALESHGVQLGWTGGVNRRAVAELVLAFAIDLLRGIHVSARKVASGGWGAIRGRELGSVTVGIVGCGHIGKEVVRLLQPFQPRILAHDIVDYADFYEAHNVTPVSLRDLLRSADVVSLHVPLDDSTSNLLDEEHLSLLRRDACLINTARGGLIDSTTLHRMLSTGRLRGAAFDVYDREPPHDSPLLTLPNFIGTAHMAGSSEQSLMAMGRAAIDGLINHRPAASYMP